VKAFVATKEHFKSIRLKVKGRDNSEAVVFSVIHVFTRIKIENEVAESGALDSSVLFERVARLKVKEAIVAFSFVERFDFSLKFSGIEMPSGE